MNSTPPVVIITGYTASGKSSLSMLAGQKYNGEIISADSWAIYKTMDIGTAKPPLQDQQMIPHHELDVVWPDGSPVDVKKTPTPELEGVGVTRSYTAAVFQANAQRHVAEITERNALPMIVGGTGLYIDSFLFDYSFTDSGDLTKRDFYNNMSLDELQDLVKTKKYDSTGVDMKNKRRLIRLLESEGVKPSRSENLRENTLVIAPKISKNQLRERIEKRTEIMFKQGLRKEVEEVTSRFGWDCDGMQGIGYREFLAWHESNISMTKVKQNITKNTINTLAKHQRTWFKRHDFINWVESNEQALSLIDDFLRQKKRL